MEEYNFGHRGKLSHYNLDGTPKKQYSEKDAVLVAYRMNMCDEQKFKIVPYKCPTCGSFHLGKNKTRLTTVDRIKIRKKYLEIAIKLRKKPINLAN